jgi:two-component system nitrogen regulation response regulator GlnG
MAHILVVDDDQSVASAFERFLAHEGHDFTIASNAEDAMRLVGECDPDLVVMDIRMPGVDGLEALKNIRSRHPDVYVALMTAYGSSQTSIDAIRSGAFEYLTKPLDLQQLRTVIQQAVAAKESRRRTSAPTEADARREPLVSLVGDTPAMRDIYKMIGRLATNDVPALITGERGTGKELVAATIHANSERRELPFVTLDCAVLSEDVASTDLFDHGEGTRHLSSVHALSRPLQLRLLQLLRGERTGPLARPPRGPRVIASTDRDLTEAVAGGSFSEQLYEMLSVITLRLPPLRDRRDDIPALVAHLIPRFNEELNRGIKGVDDSVLARFRDHSWPGNVAELATVLKRASIVTRSDIITSADVGESLTDSRLPNRQDAESALSRAVRVALEERLVEAAGDRAQSVFHEIVGLVESTLVKEALTITNGNQVKASDLLGLNRATLRKKVTSDL